MPITLPYPPSSNRYWRIFRGRAVKSAEAREYQLDAAELAVEQGMRPIVTGEVRLVLDLYRPAKRGDVDNSLKVLIDALKGVAFTDDKQVKRIEVERHDTDRHNPRAVVSVKLMRASRRAGKAKRSRRATAAADR